MNKKSRYFSQFEYEFFRPIAPAPDETIFCYIDPWVISYLTPEEKQVAEALLLQALRQKIDERWLYGLRELQSQKGLLLLRDLFPHEPDMNNKILMAETILALDCNAPESHYVMALLKSSVETSIKIKALYILRHILEGRINLKELNELVLNTLFESLKDTAVEVRKCAYDRLNDHFNLRYFTPKQDPILALLSHPENPLQYEKAVQSLQARIQSKEIYPFSREKYIQLLDEIIKQPTRDPSSCEVCKKFPDAISADLANDEAIPHKSELENAITLLNAHNCIKRCPLCFRLYYYQYHYFYYIAGQSEEDERLSRCDRAGAVELVDAYLQYYVPPERILRCGDFLVID